MIGKPPYIPRTVIDEIIKRFNAAPSKWGIRKVIAVDLGVSSGFVSNVINGRRRTQQ